MKYVVYKDTAGYWRWRLIAANNKIISDSGEGYFNKPDCMAGLNLNKSSGNAPVYEK